MHTHIISYKTLYEAIKISFDNDTPIIKLYDPNKVVNSIDDVTKDIFKKILEYADDNKVILNGVYEKNELIGYFIYRNKLLISFSIAVKYRTTDCLKAFFRLIKSEIKGQFGCMLWSKNLRAIKWLEKNGLKIIHLDPVITQLVCQ